MLTLNSYLKQEHPEILEEYKRFILAKTTNRFKTRGTKVLTLTSGYGGHGGQELIVTDTSEWHINLIDYEGNTYGCKFEDSHKDLKIVSYFDEDWNLEDIESEEY